MEVQADENRQNGMSGQEEKQRKGYNKKLSAKLYKRFSLLTFFVYYLNCMVRIITRCVSYYNQKGITDFLRWWAFVSDVSNWGEISKWVFDWYTITLIVFLLLYAIVFLFTFIRFSPQHKKTFKYFKKGFLMARRLIKIINLGLSITVLINSAQLITFADKFLFVISLCSLVFTFIQICMSITTWVISRKLSKNNTSFKAYMGKVSNVVNNYVTSARVRPEELRGDRKITIGDKLGSMRNRFFRTVEALTYTYGEARENDRMYLGESLQEDMRDPDKFENDYVAPAVEEAEVEEQTDAAFGAGRQRLRLSDKLKAAKLKKAEDKEAHLREKSLKKNAKDRSDTDGAQDVEKQDESQIQDGGE